MSDEKVVLHPLHPPGLPEHLRSVEGIDLHLASDADGVVSALDAGAEILVTYLWDESFLTGSLRWIQAVSAGMEQFPAEAVRERGVRLTSARGAHAPAVAEHAIALLMVLVRNIGPAMHDVPIRGWAPRPAHEVAGRTLGVLGLGAIGEEVASRGAALGMRVIGTKRHPETYGGVAEWVAGPNGTLDVCREADAVVIALPEADDTRRLVGRTELEALRDGWLVNVGRGSVVDEAALVEALQAGTLRGAGLDVFDVEPLPAESPLWELPTVVITPHAAWSSDRLPGRIAALFERNLAAYRGLGEWQTLVV